LAIIRLDGLNNSSWSSRLKAVLACGARLNGYDEKIRQSVVTNTAEGILEDSNVETYFRRSPARLSLLY
jgi:hypothetical protein